MQNKLIVLFVIFQFIVAQRAFSQNFDGELLLGMNMSQIDGDESSGFNKIGGIAGFYVRSHLSETVAIQSGIQYAGKGSKEEEEDNNGQMISSYKVGLHYVEIPFQFRYTWKERLFFDVGVSFGYLFSSKVIQDGTEEDKSMYRLRNFEYAMTFGAGYHLTEKIDVSARFSNTFPIPEASISDHKNMPNWFNRTLALTLAYKFNFINAD